MLTPSGPMGQTHWGDAASNTPNPSIHSTDAQLKVTPIPFSFYQYRACGYFFFTSLNYLTHYLTIFGCDQQELAAVFKKIGDKQTCTIGLYELYRITQLYPKVFCQALALDG